MGIFGISYASRLDRFQECLSMILLDQFSNILVTKHRL